MSYPSLDHRQSISPVREPQVSFTEEEVREAWKCLREYNHTIPDECLDQMRDVLLQAAKD